MNKVHVKKNDLVMVLAGRDRGKRAKVLEVKIKEGMVVVDGCNVVKRHTKPRPPKVPHGGILEVAKPIPSGKVMLVCPKCSKATRVGHRVEKDGTRSRQCKKCGEVI